LVDKKTLKRVTFGKTKELWSLDVRGRSW
jgi:hypothetical protein